MGLFRKKKVDNEELVVPQPPPQYREQNKSVLEQGIGQQQPTQPPKPTQPTPAPITAPTDTFTVEYSRQELEEKLNQLAGSKEVEIYLAVQAGMKQYKEVLQIQKLLGN